DVRYRWPVDASLPETHSQRPWLESCLDLPLMYVSLYQQIHFGLNRREPPVHHDQSDNPGSRQGAQDAEHRADELARTVEDVAVADHCASCHAPDIFVIGARIVGWHWRHHASPVIQLAVRSHARSCRSSEHRYVLFDSVERHRAPGCSHAG